MEDLGNIDRRYARKFPTVAELDTNGISPAAVRVPRASSPPARRT